MRPKYFDRNLNPISLEEWSMKMDDLEYKIIKQENIDNYFISTVWIGLDLNIIGGLPLIFETMIFVQGTNNIDNKLHLYQERYTTESQALNGHEEAVKRCFEALQRERDAKLGEKEGHQKEENELDLPQEVLDLLE